MAGRAGVDAMLYLMDEASRGSGIEDTDESQALLSNLATFPAAAWRALPTAAVRTIDSIALHVGTCKVTYDDYAFGPGTLDWAMLEVQPWPDGEAPMVETLAWLEEADARLERHDADLSETPSSIAGGGPTGARTDRPAG